MSTECETSIPACLWRENQETAQAIYALVPLVIAPDAAVAKPGFTCFIRQNTLFLEAMARALSLCVAYIPDREGLFPLLDILNQVAREILVHHDLVPPTAKRRGVRAAIAATSTRIDVMLDCARSGRVDESLAMIAAHMQWYANLGRTWTMFEWHQKHPGQAWLAVYRENAYQEIVAELDRLLNHYALDEESVKEPYRKAASLHLEFWRSLEVAFAKPAAP